MIKGLDVFKEYFSGYNEQYVIIGGAACDIVFDHADSSFRATKDIETALLTGDESVSVPPGVFNDMARFIEAFEKDPPDMKSLNISGVSSSDISGLLRKIYQRMHGIAQHDL